MSDSYWNFEDDENIICPYCGKEYEPSYEDTYISGETVDCYTTDTETYKYHTKTIDGEERQRKK